MFQSIVSKRFTPYGMIIQISQPLFCERDYFMKGTDSLDSYKIFSHQSFMGRYSMYPEKSDALESVQPLKIIKQKHEIHCIPFVQLKLG